MVLRGHANLPTALGSYLDFLRKKAAVVSDKIIQSVMANPKFSMDDKQRKTKNLPSSMSFCTWGALRQYKCEDATLSQLAR